MHINMHVNIKMQSQSRDRLRSKMRELLLLLLPMPASNSSSSSSSRRRRRRLRLQTQPCLRQKSARSTTPPATNRRSRECKSGKGSVRNLNGRTQHRKHRRRRAEHRQQ